MKILSAYKVYLILQGATALFFSMVFTVNLVYQATVVHLDPLQLVLVGTLLESVVFICEVPTGVVADVYSRRLSIIIGTALIGLGFMVEGSVPLFGMVLVAQVLWGIGATFMSGATEAWISDEVGEAAAGQAFLRGSQAGQIGGLVGIGASVTLASMRINLPILTGGMLFILLSLFLILTMPEQGFRPTPAEKRNSWQNMAHTLRGGLNMVRLRPALFTILGIGLFYGISSEGFDRLWTKHILDNFMLPRLNGFQPVVWFGVMNAVGMLLSIGATELARRRLNTNSHFGVARALFATTALLVLSQITFAWLNKFALALAAYWCIYVIRSVSGPIYTTWVNQRLDSRVRATVLSMSSQVNAIGQIAGGPVVGLVGKLASVRMALTLSGLMLSPALALYSRSIRLDAGIPLMEPEQ